LQEDSWGVQKRFFFKKREERLQKREIKQDQGKVYLTKGKIQLFAKIVTFMRRKVNKNIFFQKKREGLKGYLS